MSLFVFLFFLNAPSQSLSLSSSLGGVSGFCWKRSQCEVRAADVSLEEREDTHLLNSSGVVSKFTSFFFLNSLCFVFLSPSLSLQDDGHSFTKRHQRRRRRQHLFQKGEFSFSSQKHRVGHTSAVCDKFMDLLGLFRRLVFSVTLFLFLQKSTKGIHLISNLQPHSSDNNTVIFTHCSTCTQTLHTLLFFWIQ